MNTPTTYCPLDRPMLLRPDQRCFVLTIVCLLACHAAWGRAQSSSGMNDALQSYFAAEVLRAEKSNQRDLEEVTAENWPEVSDRWRTELREMLGLEPLPEKTDLNAVVVGTVELDDVLVERLHFQSRPGLYVTANLYRPKQAAPESGWPAVLYVCGHARVEDRGRLYGNKAGYQHHGLWFARHGVVCLMIDTIQLGELMGEHHGTYRFGCWDWISRGYTPAGVEAWNSIRAIDYLVSRPEVNAERIGITGRSGGGAYSWFTAALDTRIKVAVPVAGITDLRNHIVDGCVTGHCDCMYMINYYGWDYGKLAALVAPRALLLANSDHDDIFPMDGVLRIHGQVNRHYARLQASDHFRVILTPGPHQDTPELQVGAFRWLLKHLTDESEPQIDLPAKKEIEPRELAVFPHEIPADERVSNVAAWFVPTASDSVDDPQIAAKHWKNQWQERIERVTLRSRREFDDGLPQVQTVAEGDQGQCRWREMRWEFSGAPALGVMVFTPRNQINSEQAIDLLWADTELWRSAVSWRENQVVAEDAQPAFEEMTAGLEMGRTLYLLAPRGVGPSDWSADGRDQTQILRRYYLLGQTLESMQLWDFQMAMREVRRLHPGIDLGLRGKDRAAPLVTLAALLDGQVQRLAVINYSDDSQVAPTLPGILRFCNYADLLVAAQGLMQVELNNSRSTIVSRDPLTDPSSGPYQAMGIRTLEVDTDRATIWARTTRFQLANLGSLPEISFRQPARDGQQNRQPILPALGVEGLQYAVPGIAGEVSVRYRSEGGAWRESSWQPTNPAADFSALIALSELEPDTEYELRVEARPAEGAAVTSTVNGTFRTLCLPDVARPVRIAITTCQQFEHRDGPFGFDLYRTMLDRKTQALVHAGDVVYYDAMARSVDLANYHWQQTYGLSTLINFHSRVPSYFLKDDHDTYVNDSWPGQDFEWTEAFSFRDGQRIFRQQTALPDPAYRTFRFGRDLQVWFVEGRDYRSPNDVPDGPGKSIWGQAQWKWLNNSMQDSDARFRVLVTPTPIVGPDRNNKHDNYANDAFAEEGTRVRAFLVAQPNTFVVCGDLHWQYHSVDPETKLNEFSVGPASDRHAGGWNADDFRPEIHQFLRVAGGYLEIDLTYQEDRPGLTVRHVDTVGNVHHEFSPEG